MATDDGDKGHVCGGVVDEVVDEGACSDQVELCDTEASTLVGRGSHALQYRQERIDRVADEQNEGNGVVSVQGGGDALDDAGVDLEQVVSRHTWLSWDPGRDDDQLGVVQGVLQRGFPGQSDVVVDVGEVGADTLQHLVVDVEEGQLDVGVMGQVGLQQQGEGLADTASGTDDRYFDGPWTSPWGSVGVDLDSSGRH